MQANCSSCRHYRKMHKIRRSFCGPCVEKRDVAHRKMIRERRNYAGR